jgi:hypothetical protein
MVDFIRVPATRDYTTVITMLEHKVTELRLELQTLANKILCDETRKHITIKKYEIIGSLKEYTTCIDVLRGEIVDGSM